MASVTGVGWTNIFGLVTSRSMLAITMGITVNGLPCAAAASASSSQVRAPS